MTLDIELVIICVIGGIGIGLLVIVLLSILLYELTGCNGLVDAYYKILNRLVLRSGSYVKARITSTYHGLDMGEVYKVEFIDREEFDVVLNKYGYTKWIPMHYIEPIIWKYECLNCKYDCKRKKRCEFYEKDW